MTPLHCLLSPTPRKSFLLPCWLINLTWKPQSPHMIFISWKGHLPPPFPPSIFLFYKIQPGKQWKTELLGGDFFVPATHSFLVKYYFSQKVLIQVGNFDGKTAREWNTSCMDLVLQFTTTIAPFYKRKLCWGETNHIFSLASVVWVYFLSLWFHFLFFSICTNKVFGILSIILQLYPYL